MPNQPIRVFICEDAELIQLAIMLALRHDSAFEVVGAALDGETALERIAAAVPDVVLMDIGLPGIDGIAVTSRLKTVLPSAKVLMLTGHSDEKSVFDALLAGARGYCLKNSSLVSLKRAIVGTACGAGWLDQTIAPMVLRQGQTRSNDRNGREHIAGLTARELEVLTYLADGYSNKQIADCLLVGTETIKTHVRHIMKKLQVVDRTQATTKAIRQGLLIGHDNQAA